MPNDPWIAATIDFVDALLDRKRAAPFWKTFVPPRPMNWPGAARSFSLAQVTLKLTSPGVPDIYQGCALWDLSLVDPDNRRPVDYAPLPEILRDLDSVGLPKLLETWRDGRIKLHVTRVLLRYRREHAALFRAGVYVPLELEGDQSDRFVAFLRRHASEWVLVLVPIRLGPDANLATAGQGTRVILPGDAPGGWVNLFQPGRGQCERVAA